MSLIDVGQMKNIVDEYIEETGVDVFTVYHIHDFLDECDVVDAEPVVHSHWEVAIGYDPNKKVQCQNCFLMAHEPTSRCPHCGAHMDQEVAE